MFLRKIIDGSKLFYKNPTMVLITLSANAIRMVNDKPMEYPNNYIFELFKISPSSKALVIDGLEEGNVMIDVRSFIFDARKHYDPGTRPLIIIYTQYTMDEIRKKSFTGLECEMMQYGNCILVTGSDKKSKTKKQKADNKLGVHIFGSSTEIYSYVNHQYE